MRRIVYSLLIMLSIVLNTKAQTGFINLSAGADTVLPCNGAGCVTLNAQGIVDTGVANYFAQSTSDYSVDSIPWVASPATNLVTLTPNTDDAYYPTQTLPFTFCFYGTNYTQISVSPNGYLRFGNVTGTLIPLCTTTLVNLPNATLAPLGSIMAHYEDWDPLATAGSVTTSWTGTAPNRVFFITYNTGWFGAICTGVNDRGKYSIALYETSNVIEIHTEQKGSCISTCRGGRAMMGIQNATATLGMNAPGRNNTLYSVSSANKKSYRFVPTGAPAGAITWTNVTTNTLVGTGTTFVVCPTVTTQYEVMYDHYNCAGTIDTTLRDTITVALPDVLASVTSYPSKCSYDSTGGIIINNQTGGTSPFSASWSPVNGGTYVATSSNTVADTIKNLPAGSYTVIVTDATTCTKSYVVVIVPTAAMSIPLPASIVTLPCLVGGLPLIDSNITFVISTPAGTSIIGITCNPAPVSITLAPPRIRFANTGIPTTYTVCATNNLGCVTCKSITVKNPNPISVHVDSVTVIDCINSSACFRVKVDSGGFIGAPPVGQNRFTFALAGPGAGAAVTTFSLPQNSATVAYKYCNLSPGTYTVTVTDRYGCSTTISHTVAAYTPINLITTNPAIVCSPNTVDITTAAITAGSTGVTGGLAYFTNPGWAVVATPTAVTNGNYYIVGLGINGCNDTSVVTATITPSANLLVTNPSPVCVPNTVDITAAAVTAGSTNGIGLTYFDDAACSIAQATPNAIAIGGTYYIVSTGTNGCNDTASVNAIINPLPIVNAGLDVAICDGFSTTLAATGADTYVWAPSGPLVSPTSTTTYYVTGTTTATGCTNMDSVVVNVNPKPTVNAGLDDTICVGETAILSPTGANTYVWSPAGPTVSPSSTTTYYVTGTTTATGCTNIDSVVVTVNPKPIVNAGLDVAICFGLSTTLVPSGANTYVWSPAGPTVSPSSTTTYYVTGTTTATGCTNIDSVVVTVNTKPIVNAGLDVAICFGLSTTLVPTGANTYVWSPAGPTVSPTVTTTYYVTGTTTSTGCTNIDSVVVTVNPKPTINAGIDDTICIGQSTTLNPTGGNTYIWSPAGPNVSPTMTTTYYVTGTTTATGCTNIDSVVVVVNPLPAINAGSNISLCIGQSTIFIPTGGDSYTWAPSGPFVAPLITTTYTVTGTNTVTGCTNIDSVVVTVNPLPVVGAGADITICEGQSTLLVPSGANTYAWSPAGPNVSPIVTTTYYVTGTTTATGCTNIDSVVVTVNPKPAVDAGANVTICNGFSTTLNPTGADTYNWLPTGPLVSPTATTTYYVTGTTTATGCTNIDSVVVTVNPKPVVDAGANVTICNGFSTTLNPTGADTYTWAPLGPVVSPTNTSTYTVTGTNTVTTCTNIDSVTVTVNPTATLVVTDPAAVCSPNTVNITAASVTAGSANVTGLLYYADASCTLALASPAAVASSGTYYIIATGTGACNDTAAVTVLINASANLVLSNPAAVCFPNTVDITTAATTLGSSNVLSLLYYTNAICTIAQATPGAITASATNYIVATGAGGCNDTNAIVITVNLLPNVTANATDTIICTGGSTILSGSGASTYTWTGGISNGVSFNPIVTTSYVVTGTDANNCSNQSTITISVPPQLIIDSTVLVNPGCSPNNNGSITMYLQGGTANYQYLLNGLNNGAANASTSHVYSTLTAGPYTVSVTDINGCTAQSSVTLVSPATFTDSLVSAQSNCVPANSGSLTVFVNGTYTGPMNVYISGTASYTQLGATLPFTQIGMAPGVYNVLVTDTSSGCAANASITVAQAVNPVLIIDSIHRPLCFGDANATVFYHYTPLIGTTVSISGTAVGIPTFTSTTITNLQAGSITISISNDTTGCIKDTTFTITQPALLTSTGLVDSNVKCFGQANGGAHVTYIGGTNPVSYSWVDSSTSANIGSGATHANLAAGTYFVTITDANLCSTITTIYITQPTALVFNIDSIQNPSCGPPDGEIHTSHSGGTAGYTYTLNGLPVVAVGGVISGLSPGFYTVCIIDNNLCTTCDTVTLVTPGSPTLAISFDSVSCFGACDGAATVVASNGVAPYTYAWSCGLDITATIDSLCVGPCSVTVTDLLGCATNIAITILGPAPITITGVTHNNPTSSTATNGSANITGITGGTGPYTVSIDGINWFPFPHTFTGLGIGNYVLCATDFNNCDTVCINDTLTGPTGLVAVPTIIHELCNLANNGTVIINTGGSVGPYTYSNLGSIVPVISGANSSTATYNNVAPGTYNVTVYGAPITGDSVVLTVTVLPASIIIPGLVNTVDPTCNPDSNGTISLATITGGNDGYTDSLSGPINKPFTTWPNTFTGLVPGAYTIWIKDSNGCIVSTNATLLPPVGVSITSASSTLTGCSPNNTGTITYTYSTPNAGVSLDSLHGTSIDINYGTISIAPQFTGLIAGTYTIVVKDGFGCEATSSIMVATAAAPVLTSVNIDTILSCIPGNDAQISAQPTGAIYTYSLNGGAFQTSNAFDNLSAGNYTIVINNTITGCKDTSAVTNISAPGSPLISSAIVTNASCVPGCDATATIGVAGGASPFNYIIGTDTSTTNVIDSICVGAYVVTVTDANGCSSTTNITIVNPNAPFINDSLIQNVTCFGDTNGAVYLNSLGANIVITSVTGSGFINGYSTWSGSTISNLQSGSITITVTNSLDSCTNSISVNVGTPTAVVCGNPSYVPPTVFGGTDATAIFSASGGTPGYTYNLWNDTHTILIGSNTTGATFAGLSADCYIAEIIDAAGCKDSNYFCITQPGQLVLFLDATSNVSCNGGNNGTATVHVIGGVGGTYVFNIYGPGSPSITNTSASTALAATLSNGTFTITAADSNGAIDTVLVAITQPTPIIIDSVVITNPWCNPDSNGTIRAYAHGGTGALTDSLGGTMIKPYQNISLAFNGLTFGAYIVTVKDANGCTATTAVNLASPSNPIINSITTTDEWCEPDSNGVIIATAIGGISPYLDSLYGPINQPYQVIGAPFSNLVAGAYTVAVKDAYGCTATAPALVLHKQNPTIDSVTFTNATCNPGCDGSISMYGTTVGVGNSISYQYGGFGYQIANVFNNVCIGTYNVTIRDIYGCKDTSAVTIGTDAAPTLTVINVTNANCNPNNTGVISISSSGPNPNTFSYTPVVAGVTQSTIGNVYTVSNLTPQVYTINVIDSSGCTASMNVTVGTVPNPVIDSVTATDVFCFGDTSGVFVVHSASTSGTYTATHTNGYTVTSSSNSINSLIGGTYTITMVDGTTGCSTTGVYIIGQTSLLGLIPVATPINCFNECNGTITATASGGNTTFPYTFTVGNGTIINSNNTGNFIGLCHGQYTISVADVNGCTNSATLIVDSVTLLSLTTPLLTNVLCNGDSNGTAAVTSTGGNLGIKTFGLTYLGNNVPGSPNTTGNFNNLWFGTYVLSVTDSKSCSSTMLVNITQPPVLDITNFYTKIPTCNGASNSNLLPIIAGGTPPYLVSIDGGSNYFALDTFHTAAGLYTVCIKDSNNCIVCDTVTIGEPTPVSFVNKVSTNVTCFAFDNGTITPNVSGGTPGYLVYEAGVNLLPASGVFNNLTPGMHYLFATDTNGCVGFDSILITEPTILNIVTDSVFDVSCFGQSNGFIYTHAEGGTPGYSFIRIPNQTVFGLDSTFTGLAAGSYIIVTMDANGCLDSTNEVINTPAAMLLSQISSVNVRCFGESTGTIDFVITGGSPAYTITYTPTVGNLSEVAGVVSVVNLPAGTYNFTIVDVNGCATTLTRTITQNPLLVIDSITMVPPRCFGEPNGSITVVASGGVPALLYSINPGPGLQASNTFGGLVSNLYSITVTDAVGCTKTAITNLSEPNPLLFSQVTVTDVNCFGANDGTVVSQAIGGNGNYEYYVRPGVRTNTTGTFVGFDLGTYTLTVEDSLGCRRDTVFTINNTSTPLTLSTNKADITNCKGFGSDGAANVIAVGGAQPYTYLWNTPIPSTSASVNSLIPGFYVVQVTDASGCVEYDTVRILPANCCTDVWLPNAFTPNNDNNNDIYKLVTASGIQIIDFIISDRWGNKVFNTTDQYTGWDGNFNNIPAENGSYVYLFKYRCDFDGNIYIKKGDITLVR
jgi:gliding motility-associated-like protein